MATYIINDRQRATLIASLRYYQENWQHNPEYRTAGIEEVASDSGSLEPLGDEEVNDLVQHLQTGAVSDLPDIDQIVIPTDYGRAED